MLLTKYIYIYIIYIQYNILNFILCSWHIIFIYILINIWKHLTPTSIPVSNSLSPLVGLVVCSSEFTEFNCTSFIAVSNAASAVFFCSSSSLCCLANCSCTWTFLRWRQYKNIINIHAKINKIKPPTNNICDNAHCEPSI